MKSTNYTTALLERISPELKKRLEKVADLQKKNARRRDCFFFWKRVLTPLLFWALGVNTHPHTTKIQTNMKMTNEELKAKLDAHALWLKTRDTDKVQGERADLTGADLTGAKLMNANLTYANLTYANLTYANLTYANLTYANLTGANLNILKASAYVYDALAAVFAAQMALKKTGIKKRAAQTN